jgi:hypothetical protein
LEIDQYNEQAWLWLSAVVETPEEQRTCLDNVLTINPNSERAKTGHRHVGSEIWEQPKVSPTQAEDVMAGSSFYASSTSEVGQRTTNYRAVLSGKRR